MTAVSAGKEARINEALRRLGDEFRLGMVPEEEYRKRRRLLLESWGERDVTTAPGNLRNRRMQAAVAGNVAVKVQSRRPLWIGLAILTAAVTYTALFSNGPKTPPNDSPVTATLRSPQLTALLRSADDFVEQNRWGEIETDAFLREWRSLSQEDRARARQEPAFRTLRHKLAQNIQAESQASSDQNDTAQTGRFERLQKFASELDADDQ